MFFIYGRRNIVLKTYSDFNSICDNCESRSLDYSVKQEYFHIMWIPFFPTQKFVSTNCNKCKDSRQIAYGETAKRFENQTRTPIYMYSFIILLIIFLVSATISANNETKEMAENFKNPMVGDVYCYKFKDELNKDSYSFLKLKFITEDSIFFYHCNLCYNQHVKDYNSSSYFVQELYGQSQLKVNEMFIKKEIVDIYRSYNENSWFNEEKNEE